jgi:hypothetical protein
MAVPAPRYDVPLALTVGVVGLLVALFVPLSHVTPAYPTELAHLRVDEDAVLHDHRAALARPAPPAAREVLRAWDAWCAALAREDRVHAQSLRETFARRLADATMHVRTAQEALRARATERFLARLDAPNDPLTQVAARHGLAHATSWHATRSARIAWFALRWERALAEPDDNGDIEPFSDTLLRVPPSYRRAFASWALAARCPELVGTMGRPANADHVRACGRFRSDLIELAARLDPRYPREEALAAADTMLALGLRRATMPAPDTPIFVADDAARSAALADAQAALLRAEARYATMLRTAPSRRIERLYRGVTAALGDDTAVP